MRPLRVLGQIFRRSSPASSSYTFAEGTTREVPWEVKNSGLRGRVGGAKLRLGDHPYAMELASLGLPKRAMVSASVANVDMTFGDARVLD